jgi:alpha-mannosidase
MLGAMKLASRRSVVRVAGAWALALTMMACARGPATAEGHLRQQLGIPVDAKHVIVFGQNAHLDIDWQHTFADYYTLYVDNIFKEARGILDAQPRAFYSVAEMAYLAHHVSVNPGELAALKRHAALGALRVVGGGLTSPDTLLPETELLLRDYLYGTQFAEEMLGVRPTAAWLPDSFGHAATLPDLLTEAGFTSVAFARVDGAPTFNEALRAPPPGPKPGSTAELLAKLGANDFLWRGPGGGEILAHFMPAGLYCQGDNIDYEEPIELPGGHLGAYNGNDPSFTDGQIDSYIAALTPYARTQYLFVPVGCDFQHPKPQLITYLDGYNRRRYPSTGVWAVAAPFDDYATLVLAHKAALPSLTGELSPYFMGFYGSRPAVKKASRAAAQPLFAAEMFATLLDGFGGAQPALTAAFSELARSDHHDFITGTANDMVYASEQLPLLADVQMQANRAAATVAQKLVARIPPVAGALARVLVLNPAGQTRDAVVDVPVAAGMTPRAAVATQPIAVEPLAQGTAVRLGLTALAPFSWTAIDLFSDGTAPAPAVTLQLVDGNGQPASGDAVQRIVLANARVRAELTRDGGFALTSLTVDGREAIAARSFLLADYADQGGLWRLGNEMKGCALTAMTALAEPETIVVREQSALRVRVTVSTADATRELGLDAGDDGLFLALTTAAAKGTTRTASFTFTSGMTGALRTSTAAGFVDRTVARLYTPTFWPAVEWLGDGDWILALRQSTGVRFDASGNVELLAVRNAQHEVCDNEGGSGSDGDMHRIEWRIGTATSPAGAAQLAQSFNRPVVAVVAAGPPAAAPDLPATGTLLSVSGDGIVTAIKPAERGPGIVVRALNLPGPVTLALPPPLANKSATRLDAVERDLESLGTAGATLTLDPARFGIVAGVRLR